MGGAGVGVKRVGGDGDAGVGPGGQGPGGGGLVEIGDGQAQALTFAVYAFAGDVIPVGIGLVVGEQGEAVDERRPTDAGIAGASERDHPGMAGEFALGDVVEGELAVDEGEGRWICGGGRDALGDDEFGFGEDFAGGQHVAEGALDGGLDVVGRKVVGGAEVRAAGVERWSCIGHRVLVGPVDGGESSVAGGSLKGLRIAVCGG